MRSAYLAKRKDESQKRDIFHDVPSKSLKFSPLAFFHWQKAHPNRHIRAIVC